MVSFALLARETLPAVAWCIMPNHVHVVCRLLPGHNLSDVLKGWKAIPPAKRIEFWAEWERFGGVNTMTGSFVGMVNSSGPCSMF